MAKRILTFLHRRVVANLDDLLSLGEALRGPRLGEFWKYRVGDYRIIASDEGGQQARKHSPYPVTRFQPFGHTRHSNNTMAPN